MSSNPNRRIVVILKPEVTQVLTTDFIPTTASIGAASTAISANTAVQADSASFAETASFIVTASFAETASFSQIAASGTGSFTGTFIGDGALLTGIVAESTQSTAISSSHALRADIANVAEAVSASNLVGIPANADTASFILGSNIDGAVNLANTASYVSASDIDGVIVSASHAVQADNAQIADTASYIAGSDVDGAVALATLAAGAITASDVAYDDVRDKPTLVSSSIQITGQLDVTGVTGSFTGTFVGDGSELSGVDAETASYVAGGNVDGAVATASFLLGSVATASYVAGGNVDGAVELSNTASYVAGGNVDGAVASSSFAATGLGTFSGSFSGTLQPLTDTLRFYDGASVDTIDVNFLSNGTTVSASIESQGGGDIHFFFTGTLHTMDTTPVVLVELTAGSDISPQENFIYVTGSGGTLSLVAVTTDWPTGAFAPIATVFVQSPTSASVDGILKGHVWTDHLFEETENGQLSHINKRLRSDAATWVSGIAAVFSSSVDEAWFSTETGIVFQLHDHDMPALDMAAASASYLVNDPTTIYKRITGLSGITQDASGDSLVNNRYYNFVIWGVISEDAADSHIFINLPTTKYNTEAAAQSDTAATAVYSIPTAFRGTSFLIARATLQFKSSGVPWIESLITDLRGLVPSTSPGGGASISDHGSLSGLLDDGDHPQFLLTSGTRPLTGAWNAGQSITSSFQGSLEGTADTASYVAGANVDGAVSFADTGSYVAGSDVDGAVALADTGSYVAGANVDGAVATADTASLVLGGNVVGAVALADTASLVLGANVQGAVAVLDGEATGTLTGSFLGGVNLTNPSDMSGSTFAHQMPPISGKSADFTISLDDNQNQQFAISASLEFLVEDGSVGQFNSIHFINSGAFGVSWPSNMKYHAGTAITTSITSGALDIYTFTRLPDGTYAASIFGQDIA